MTWMKEKDGLGGFRAQLTFDQLKARLKRMGRLMKINGWTAQANEDYYELFNVDKNAEWMKSHIGKAWKPSHRLVTFAWDEACEYPFPDNESQDQKENREGDDPLSAQRPLLDECLAASQLGVLQSLLGSRAFKKKPEGFDVAKELGKIFQSNEEAGEKPQGALNFKTKVDGMLEVLKNNELTEITQGSKDEGFPQL